MTMNPQPQLTLVPPFLPFFTFSLKRTQPEPLQKEVQKEDKALATGSQVKDLAKGCQDRALAKGWQQQQPKDCPEPLRKGIEAIMQYSKMIMN